MHLFGDTKVVFFIVFNISKLLLFCISLSFVDSMFYAFCLESKYLSLLPPGVHNFHSLFCSNISLLTFSFHHQVCFHNIPFFVHPLVLSVAESRLKFQPRPNIVYLLTWCVINFTCKSFTRLITKISLFELPCTLFWYKFITPIFTFYSSWITNR